METEEIWIPAMQPSAAFCRICVLPNDGDITLINQPMNEHDGTNSLQRMLEKLFPSVFSVEHLRSDEGINWPTKICQGCKRKVKDAYGLYELCVASTERLRKMLSEECVAADVPGSEVDTDFLLVQPAEDWIKVENVSEVNELPSSPNPEFSAQGLINSEEYSEQSTILRNSPTAKKSRAPRKLKATSNEDRERIVLSFERGNNVATIAKRLNIKRGTVYNVLRKYQNTRRVEADRRGKLIKKKITPEISEQIRAWIDEDCTLSLGKLAQNILAQYHVQVCPSTIAKEIGDFNYSLKRIDLHPEGKHTKNKLAERKEYATSLTAILCRVPESNIIFLNEVGFKVSLRVMRRFGKGSEAGKIITHLRVRNISVVCAMHTGRILHYMPRNRLIDKDFFVTFLRELFEKLSFANISPAVVIMENVALHKCEEVKALFNHSPYETMYLPPHSPFLNPVETLFNNFKEICKRANPESEEEVITDIENGNNLITALDCKNYFKHMWEFIPRCLREEQIDDL